jgi:hypothetical protein
MKIEEMTVPSNDFVEWMDRHWQNELENVSSHALRETWRQIANVFRVQIQEQAAGDGNYQWKVLSPPTGAGKTESTIIYCALLADLPDQVHPGALIVTRRIADCNNIADRVNRFSSANCAGSRESAVAYHSENNIQLLGLPQYPVVVITHRAYELALEALGKGGEIPRTWPHFHNWQKGTRKLIVIDESLDVLDHSKVSLDGLRQTEAAIRNGHWDQFPEEHAAVKSVIKTLARVRKLTKDNGNAAARMTISEPREDQMMPDLTDLIESLDGITFDYKDPRADQRYREIHKARLRELHVLFRSWSFFQASGADPQLHTAKLLLPEGVKGAVVMDATAQVNKVFGLSDMFRLLNNAAEARNYRNVTVYVSRGHKTGKVSQAAEAKKVCSDLVQNLGSRLKGRKVFVVCHKDIEPTLNKFELGLEMKTGHWGAIDGSNEWRDCDTAVIMSLPHMPPPWSNSVYMAFKGPQNNAFFGEAGIQARQDLEHGQIAASVIQAINRIRCRRTINAEGDCEPVDIFMLLPADKLQADAILEMLVGSMPRVRVKSFEFEHNKKLVKGSKNLEALVSLMKNFPWDRAGIPDVCRVLDMSRATLKRCLQTLSDPESPLSLALRERGVVYEVERVGRTQRASFVKA